MRINNLPLRYRIYAFAAGLIVMVWLFVSMVLLPAQQRIASLENQLRIERNLVKVVQEFGLAHPEPAKYLKLLDAKLSAFERLLPSDLAVNDFLIQCEAAAKTSGVHLIALKPGVAANINIYRELPIELTIRGSYFQTMNFLKQLESGPRFNTITNLSMQAKQEFLESKLTVSVFSFDLAAVPGTQFSVQTK